MVQELGSGRWPIFLGAIALVSLVWTIFFPVLGFEFMAYDVPGQILENPYVWDLSAENVKHILTTRCITSYYPVRTLSYAIDYHFWGREPCGFKLTNVLIHLANVLLVFWLILRLFRHPAGTGGPPAGTWNVGLATFSAGIFAAHPVVVEPVTWVAGREELLMTLGALGCIHFHVTARRLGHQGGKTGWALACHASAALCCALACLSNAVGAVIPLLITAWDVLAPDRPKWRRIVAGTAALWAIGVMTMLMKSDARDFAGSAGAFSAERVMLVLNVYWLNLKTLFRPTNLLFCYPHAIPESFLETEVILGAIAVGLTFVLLWTLRRRAFVLFGLVWFGLALGPSSQVVNHPIHRADRFLYLPLVGLAVALALGLKPLENALKGRVAAAVVAGVGVLGLLGILSAGQVQTWQDTLSVWRNSLGVHPDHPTAHAGIGYQLAKSGQMRLAIEHYEASIAVQPLSEDVLNNFAMDLATCPEVEMRDYHRAIELARRACTLTQGKDPESRRTLAVVHARFAQALAGRREFVRAIDHCRLSLEADAACRPALLQLAMILSACPDERIRRPNEAVRLAERACQLTERPGPAELGALATTYAEAGRLDEAVATAEQALQQARSAGDAELVEEFRSRVKLYQERISDRQRP